MSELTKEQQEFFEKEEKRLETFFENPIYESFKIRYVKKPEKADVFISKNHNIFDYLAIGFICLNKQLKGYTERVVYVGHKKYDNIDVIKLMDNIYPLNGGGKRVPGTALSELIDQIADVAERYYKNPRVCSRMSGLIFAPHLTCVSMGYYEDPDMLLEFENFDDTIYAQQLAFNNLKKHIISSNLGAIYAMLYGD